MRFIKKLFFVIFLLILYFNIYSVDYYICLGSFIDSNNAVEYSINLNKIGINTILEKTKIKNKYFTRVLLSTKFKNFKDAVNELKKLLNNEVIKKANIKDLWVRPGKILNVQTINNIKSVSNTKNIQLKEPEKKEDKKSNEIKIKGKAELDKEPEQDKNTGKITNEKEKIELEELNEKNEIKETKQVEVKKEEITKSKENKFKIIDNEGYANCIFASQPIELGKESNYELKKVFNKPEKIYARCYLPGNIGKIDVNDFWHEIWIDGKFIRKTVFNSPPNPDWDQIQIWVSEEDYSDILNSLEKGEHKITIWVLKNEIKKDNDKSETITVKLSKGEFTYIIQ